MAKEKKVEQITDMEVDFAQWYTDICRKAELVEYASVKGITILLVEQNANVALKIADYAFVLETGSLGVQGKGSDLLNDPAIKAAYLGKAR